MSNSVSREKLLRLSLRELLVIVALVALAIASLAYASDVWAVNVLAITVIAFFVATIVSLIDRGPRQAFAIGFAVTMLAYAALLITAGRVAVPGFGATSHNLEFDPWSGRLPTTRLLRYVYMGVNRSEYIPLLPPLQAGTTGDLVAVLQRMLNAKIKPSPNIQVDGDFGPITEAAVKKFQAQAALKTTGIMDYDTWTALGPVIDAKTGDVLGAYAPKDSSINIMRVSGFGGFGGGSGLPSGQVVISHLQYPPQESFMPIGHCWWALLFGYVGGHFARLVYWRRFREQPSLATESS